MSSLLAIEQYKLDNNSFIAFARDYLIPDSDGIISKKDLRAMYKQWCIDNGFLPLGDKRIRDTIKQIFPTVSEKQIHISGQRDRYWIGLKYQD